MNKLYTLFWMAFLATGMVACSDDDCGQLHIDTDMMGIPTVMKGSFPVGTLTPAVGDSIVYAPQLMDTTGVVYAWELNGKKVSSDSVFAYKIEKPCRAKVVCTLKNPKGEVILESDIVVKPDFTKGFVVIQKGTIDFYDAEKEQLYTDVYSALNYGEGIPVSSYDDLFATVAGGKMYALISTSTSNRNHLYVADSKTLYGENAATIAANLDAFIPLNGKQALIAGGGAYRIDLASLSSVRLLKQYGWGVYNGIVFQGKLLGNMTYSSLAQVNYYDLNALTGAGENGMPEASSLDIWQNGKINFVESGDGNVYTVGCNADGTEYYLAQIQPDFSVKTVSLPFKPLLSAYSSGLYTVGMAVSQAGDAIYIPAENNAVYKYILGNAASLNEPFIAVPEGDEELCGTGLNVNPANGELWVCYAEETGWNEYTGKIVVYDATGLKKKSIDCGDTAPQSILFNN